MLAGRFEVLGSVGRGAIAEVVRARDGQTGREVALKILYPHLRESAAVVERFRREVEIVRRVAHPHVLGISDVIDGEGRLFLVMDYHPGGDLAAALARQRRLGADELRDLARQLCGALAAAHGAGVVHRDVKPSNVLCGPGPALDVRLCDFGLARTADLSGLTTANAVLGTPEYMAPEVVTEGHADPRSDIYSLGVVLFECATGRLPFYADSPYQLMRQHVDSEAPRARSLAADLPPAIDEAIARALAKDPLDRFATADDLARAMADGEPAQASGTAAPATSSALAPLARPAPPARRTCTRCGGWLVDAAAVCADCGTSVLRLEHERGGVAVLVTGPGSPGDKVDAWRHVELFKILDELPAGWLTIARGRRRAPRVPFYVARALTRDSASALVSRLQAIGFESRVETRGALAPREVRRKVWELTKRPFASLVVVVFGSQVLWPRLPIALLMVLPPLLLAAGAFGIIVAAALRGSRPLVAAPSERAREVDAAQQLAGVLARLASRQDRRLGAHIVERLAQIARLGRAPLAQPLAGRAARAANALATLDARRGEDASVPREASRALEELRGEEQTRVVLRADLLRTASRLDDLGLALARAGARAGGPSDDDRARVEQELQELAFALEAQQELEALLAGGGAR